MSRNTDKKPTYQLVQPIDIDSIIKKASLELGIAIVAIEHSPVTAPVSELITHFESLFYALNTSKKEESKKWRRLINDTRTLIFKLNKGEGDDELDALTVRIKKALESKTNNTHGAIPAKTLKRVLVSLKQSVVIHGLIHPSARQQMRALILHMRADRLSSKEVMNNDIQKSYSRHFENVEHWMYSLCQSTLLFISISGERPHEFNAAITRHEEHLASLNPQKNEIPLSVGKFVYTEMLYGMPDSISLNNLHYLLDQIMFTLKANMDNHGWRYTTICESTTFFHKVAEHINSLAQCSELFSLSSEVLRKTNSKAIISNALAILTAINYHPQLPRGFASDLLLTLVDSLCAETSVEALKMLVAKRLAEVPYGSCTKETPYDITPEGDCFNLSEQQFYASMPTPGTPTNFSLWQNPPPVKAERVDETSVALWKGISF